MGKIIILEFGFKAVDLFERNVEDEFILCNFGFYWLVFTEKNHGDIL